ncbi:MAG: hypothetical protein WCF33_22030 [Pseudonocardiaceae bacterium]
MGTPSERIFAHRADDDGVELRHFLPAQARHPVTLAQTADRIAEGTALRDAMADFVDDLRWARDADESDRSCTAFPAGRRRHCGRGETATTPTMS